MPAEAGNPDADDETVQRLRGGRYVVLGTLGVGSQAQTLEADDLHAGIRVAIKRFVVRGKRSWKEVELAEREAAVLSQLQHPNLPRYFEHFEEDGVLYLVMEKIEGKTLAELRRSATLSQVDTLRFLNDASGILNYLHGRAPPIIHRDIKPENVIRRPDGSFALVDFGSVRERLRPEGGSTVVGTFGYMAPEQFQGRALPTTDVYGVGATAIACLSGQDPDKLPHRGLAIDVPRSLGPNVDQRFVELLSKLLDPDPDRRVANLDQALKKAFQREGRGPAQGRSAHERTDAREDERRLRRELQEARQRRRRERKQRRSRPRWDRPHQQRGRHGGSLGALLWLLLPTVFLIARLATFGLFRVFLPVLLGLLAIFFGAGLDRARRRCVEVGRAGEAALRRATARLQPEQPTSHLEADDVWVPRVRVTSDPIANDKEDDEAQLSGPPAKRRGM